jgi:hypothetical protein
LSQNGIDKADRMEVLFEILFGVLEVIAELLLQLFVEVLVEFGLRTSRSKAGPQQSSSNPWLAGLGYLLLGAGAGVISLWPFPSAFIESDTGRVINLMCTPLVAGFAMGALGGWRLRRGQELIRMDRFAYGYVFALGMGIVRFQFAQG